MTKRITRMLSRGMLISKKAKKLHVDGVAVAKGLLNDRNVREKVVTDEFVSSTFEMLSSDSSHVIGTANLSILVAFGEFHDILAQKASAAVDDLVDKSREDRQLALQALLLLAGIDITRQAVLAKLKTLIDEILVAEKASDIVGGLRLIQPFLRIGEIRELVLDKNVSNVVTTRCDGLSPKEEKDIQKAVASFNEELYNSQNAGDALPVSDDGVSVASSSSRILVDDV
ncbi:hypothetical protein CONPUDRAFT_84479 [Coniophora puteana RWD-64-598 SS2]|uniref:Uncharacterized protein n=1 Tax=Coniophora puteana (strain RWD-64-598) TaxID=741705 RepID=A0A5M3MDN1_CONPW|nr:uncharacterized protein CONPUDRAFT_84479 [Coniophora puteana RWD-64-598 SS2]EIW77372.1 hypothetical protein CONPUDRAFT_84479 [Coniophora puteana RWD-64-598 SS2]